MASAVDSSKFLVSEAHLVLDAKRKELAKRIKNRGDPIELPNGAIGLAIQIRGDTAWIAENTALVRSVNLETGKTLAVYRGHKAPVTCLVLYTQPQGKELMISGSWDKSIIVWDVASRRPLSTTPSAHSDFVKRLLVLPKLNLLVSSGSDKIIRFWDLSSPLEATPLKCKGSISQHSRPVESLALDGDSTLYTADTMGVIMAWNITKEVMSDGDIIVRAEKLQQLDHHRTRINDMWIDKGLLWTASSDETVQVIPTSSPIEEGTEVETAPPKPLVLQHPLAARALLPLPATALGEDEAPYLIASSGDALYIYELEFLHGDGAQKPPESILLRRVDEVHWHEIPSLALWLRTETLPNGDRCLIPWIVSSSLDGTIRKWKLSDLLNPASQSQEADIETPAVQIPEVQAIPEREDDAFKLSEEEERELADLMEDD